VSIKPAPVDVDVAARVERDYDRVAAIVVTAVDAVARQAGIGAHR
jgi:hypothetical protein